MKEQLRQTTDTVVMITPDHFGFNPETAASNDFQVALDKSPEEIQKSALYEFQKMVETLAENNIRVITLPSRKDVITPDEVFPNNWFSHHGEESLLVIYPMLAPNRRLERQPRQLQGLLDSVGIRTAIVDFSHKEKSGQILEGTGSMVLDRENKIAFAIGSPRTSREAFEHWCRVMDYKGVFFYASNKEDKPIYHTNVIMGIGEKFTVVCFESIKDDKEREEVRRELEESGRKIIPITLDQVTAYCGNVLELKSKKGEPKIVMSKTSWNAFTPDQKETLQNFGDIVAVEIPTIETVGGGSARCMLAEIFVKDN